MQKQRTGSILRQDGRNKLIVLDGVIIHGPDRHSIHGIPTKWECKRLLSIVSFGKFSDGTLNAKIDAKLQ